MSDLFADASARLSRCGRYRYRLGRKWGGDPHALFIMLNPSTADAFVDDPTIRRCMGFARTWGCGGIEVVNLFAFRAASPKDMLAAGDPVGPDNMDHIKAALDEVGWFNDGSPAPVICAWGTHGRHMDQDRTVFRLIHESGAAPMSLRITKGGSPSHPLYLPGDLVPMVLGDIRTRRAG